MENREDNIPFERLEIISEEEETFRVISDEQLEHIYKLVDPDYYMYIEEFVPEDHPLSKLYQAFEHQVLYKDDENEDEDENSPTFTDRVYLTDIGSFPGYVSTKARGKLKDLHIDVENIKLEDYSTIGYYQDNIIDNSDDLFDNDNELINPMINRAELLSKLIEPLIGQLSDPDYYKDEIKEILYSSDISDHRFAKGIDVNPYTEKNMFELSLDSYCQILVEHNLEKLAAQLSKTTNHEQCLEILGKYHIDKRELLIEKERLSITDQKSKGLHSKKIKFLKEKYKQEQNLIDGIKDFYNISELLAKSIGSKLKKIAKSLKKQAAINKIVKFYLDGTPDEKLDADPGAVSGDCTEDKPIPFNITKELAYNIKVRISEQVHVGNIYLWQTNEAESGKKLWHLDAIQIPYYTNWKMFIENLFSSLTEQAKKKNINGISFNTKNELISNYDYIYTAVMAYANEHGAELGKIKTIELLGEENYNKESFSNFQTTGEVYIIPIQ